MAALDEYRSESERLAKVATEKTSSATVLPDKIKNIINTKLEGNRDIIEQQRAAQGKYFGAGDVAREKFGGTFNPLKKEQLVNQYRTQAFAPYAALSDVRANREGTIGDIVGQASRAGVAEAQSAYGAAGISRQAYQDLLGEYQFGEQLKREDARIALSRASANRGPAPRQVSLSEIIAGKQLGIDYEGGESYEDYIGRVGSEGVFPEEAPYQPEPYSEEDYLQTEAGLIQDIQSGQFSTREQAEAYLVSQQYNPVDFKDILDEYSHGFKGRQGFFKDLFGGRLFQ